MLNSYPPAPTLETGQDCVQEGVREAVSEGKPGPVTPSEQRLSNLSERQQPEPLRAFAQVAGPF